MQTTYFPFRYVYLKSRWRVNEVKKCLIRKVCLSSPIYRLRSTENPFSPEAGTTNLGFQLRWYHDVCASSQLSTIVWLGWVIMVNKRASSLMPTLEPASNEKSNPFLGYVCQQKTDNTSQLHSTLTKIGMYVVLCWKDVLVTVLILVGQRWKLEEPFWEASSRGRTALWDYSWGPPNRVVAGQVVIFAL